MYPCFSLSLMVTHACNLRCDYCYTGRKSDSAMSAEVSRAAIDRALRSIERDGMFELVFFGGEPLFEADLIADLIEYAKRQCRAGGYALHVHLTTNGTLSSGAAWTILTRPEITVHVSHDGLPEVHDRHRRTADGRGTSEAVLATLARLQKSRNDGGVVMVLRPDTVESFSQGIRFLRGHGVRQITPTLDLWTRWSPEDAARLETALVRAADVWREGLPECGVSWFDEKAARLAGFPPALTARCGFGDGEVAVAPSGNLYPCERLIGEDLPDNPMRLPGSALEDTAFPPQPAPGRNNEACTACGIQSQCNTTCRCANYVRTGDVRRPDGLLCLLDRVLYRETARILDRLPLIELEAKSVT
ncbi:MAG: radical SAM protein [Pirellulales bacterium]|nr:radical SAM protein [Pirellulales bacterium]